MTLRTSTAHFENGIHFHPKCTVSNAEPIESSNKKNPIRLHYATAVIESSTGKQGQSGRVWIEVDNIAFEKKVAVECEDRDGVWRRYPAFFLITFWLTA